MWAICEETNWVAPAHEYGTIDLFAAETGFLLAELLHLIGGDFPWEVRRRIREEIDRRIFTVYFAQYNDHHWHKCTNNWNGVCNSSVGSTFLYLEKDPERLADAICQVLDGLEVFFETAFEEDGGSTEGTGYWQYGLLNFVSFAELLRERTGGEIDLLSLPRVRTVAAYPLNMVMSPGRYANFSDCDEYIYLNPGFITRLAEKTDRPELRRLSENTPTAGKSVRHWRLPIMLRDILWSNDCPAPAPDIQDTYLESTAVVRFVSETPNSLPVVLAAKAGHNAENHNQNDVGTFIVHRDGESFICDPGRGLYDRKYFARSARYLNVFCSSYGHSVPRIGDDVQKHGDRKYGGKVLDVRTSPTEKKITMDIAGAYGIDNLKSLVRDIRMKQEGDFPTITLSDTFEFAGEAPDVEEAFMTFLDVIVDGPTAVISGTKADLVLSIEGPSGTGFAVEDLEEECRANMKETVLERISFRIHPHDNRLAAKVSIKFRQK